MEEESKEERFSPEFLDKLGVLKKEDNGRAYFEAEGGQITWIGAPDAAQVYYRYKDGNGNLLGQWISR